MKNGGGGIKGEKEKEEKKKMGEWKWQKGYKKEEYQRCNALMRRRENK